jgi:hypothetical protein
LLLTVSGAPSLEFWTSLFLQNLCLETYQLAIFMHFALVAASHHGHKKETLEISKKSIRIRLLLANFEEA